MKKKVLIAGGSGLVGSRLTQLLLEKDYEVLILSRSKKKQGDNYKFIQWDPQNGSIDKEALTAKYVINLAGAGIADRPWTKSRKKELADSRLNSTNFLFEQFQKNKAELKTYLGASAIGYYGEGGDQWQSEDQSPTTVSFMTDLCKDWESVHLQFSKCAQSTSVLRIGIVLSTLGGAYPKMRLPFKVGVGSYFGSGNQYYSWIHIDDLAKMFIHLLDENKDDGIYNAVSPNPKSNKDITVAIKDALNINSLIIPAPAFTLKLAMGELSDVILNSNRVSSSKIEKAGYHFKFPEIENAIRDIEERSI